MPYLFTDAEVCPEGAPVDGVLVVGVAFVGSGVHLCGRVNLHLALDFVSLNFPLVDLHVRVCVQLHSVLEPRDVRPRGSLSLADKYYFMPKDILVVKVGRFDYPSTLGIIIVICLRVKIGRHGLYDLLVLHVHPALALSLAATPSCVDGRGGQQQGDDDDGDLRQGPPAAARCPHDGRVVVGARRSTQLGGDGHCQASGSGRCKLRVFSSFDGDGGAEFAIAQLVLQLCPTG